MKTGTVELVIERIVAGGFGLARSADGVVLVRGGLPGERVTARPRADRGVLRAHAIEILEPHPSRVATPLPPGADLPLEPEAQLGVKHGLVVEAIERVGRLDPGVPVEPVRASPDALGYRASAQYAAIETGGLGARSPGSDRIVALDADPLLIPPLARAFEVLRERPLPDVDEVVLRGSLHADTALVGIVGGRTATRHERLARRLHESKPIAGVTWTATDARGRFRGRIQPLAGTHTLLEDFGGVLASVTVASFAQVNPRAAGVLFREAAALAGSGARAIDLYAGSGVLGLHLAPAFTEVIAVEIAADAVRRGRADASRLGVEHLRFEQADARAASKHFPADVVVVDPPRAGLSAETVDLLLEHAPPRIVYVSCNPSTWARDVARLSDGGYRLSVVRPFDFYPYTHHVEVLSLLER